MVAISAGYHFTEQQTTLAKRKARLARMLKLFEQANGVLEIAEVSRGDDPDFFHSPLMMLVLEATGPVLEAQSALSKEIVRTRRAEQSRQSQGRESDTVVLDRCQDPLDGRNISAPP